MSSKYISESSSEEDEDVGILQDVVRDHLEGIPCKNSKCDQELVFVHNKKEYYCSRDCYHSVQERLKLGLTGDSGVEWKRLTIPGRGGTGLLSNPGELDHLRIKVKESGQRIVAIQNTGANAARWKGTLEQENEMKRVKRESKEKKKQQLKALLNICSDDSSSSSDDEEHCLEGSAPTPTEEAHEEIQSMLGSGADSAICPVHAPIKGKLMKGFIINVASPWEIYVQTEDMLMKSQEIDDICNRPEGIDPRLVLPLWSPKIGGYCTAKYEDKFYRAKILDRVASGYKVKFMDYGNVSVVAESEILQLNPQVSLIPRQYIFVKISNVKPKGGEAVWRTDACEFAQINLDGGIVSLEIESVEHNVIHWSKMQIHSSINLEKHEGDFGEVLVQRGMADSQIFFN